MKSRVIVFPTLFEIRSYTVCSIPVFQEKDMSKSKSAAALEPEIHVRE